MSAPFRFKQFTIQQNLCAMKVGTDGVLLGAWAKANNPKTILDIGTGTGLIALMLAQRFINSHITAIDKEETAIQQAIINVQNSVFKDRINVVHSSLQEYNSTSPLNPLSEEPVPIYREKGKCFDLIVCNPPYFEEDVTSPQNTRDKARHTRWLPFEDLISISAGMLTSTGSLNVIIPYNREDEFLAIAEKHNLYPTHITHVKGTAEKPIKRSLIAVSFNQTTPTKNQLVIEISRHNYTPQYMQLTKEFYLKF